MPEVGESVELDGWRFTVAEVDGRRVRSLRISELASEVAAVADAGEAGDGRRRGRDDVASPG